MFHSRTLLTYHYNSSWTIRQARNYLCKWAHTTYSRDTSVVSFQYYGWHKWKKIREKEKKSKRIDLGKWKQKSSLQNMYYITLHCYITFLILPSKMFLRLYQVLILKDIKAGMSAIGPKSSPNLNSCSLKISGRGTFL